MDRGSFFEYVNSLPEWTPGRPFWTRYKDPDAKNTWYAIKWYSRGAPYLSTYLWLHMNGEYSIGGPNQGRERIPKAITTWQEAERYVETLARLGPEDEDA